MTSVHAILKKYSIRPSKRLGQHFLAAEPTVKKIASSLEIEKNDVVLEIGCGPGVMTGIAASAAKKVIAVERDKTLIGIAKSELETFTNVEWICDDILNVDVGAFFQEKYSGHEKLKILGNLPYNISSQIIFWMIDAREFISKAVIMLQKEVALRLCAGPGGKDYGILSVLSQAHAKCQKLFDVSAKSFIPPPEVTSAVVSMDFGAGPFEIPDEDRFRRVVRAAFAKRRKQIRNSLIGAKGLGVSATEVDMALKACSIDPTRRPETLKIQEFVKLSKLL